MVSCDGNNYYFNFVTHNSKWCKFSLVTMSRDPMIIFFSITINYKECAVSSDDGSPWFLNLWSMHVKFVLFDVLTPYMTCYILFDVWRTSVFLLDLGLNDMRASIFFEVLDPFWHLIHLCLQLSEITFLEIQLTVLAFALRISDKPGSHIFACSLVRALHFEVILLMLFVLLMVFSATKERIQIL